MVHRRRSRGEGTVRQRADGRWEARLRQEGTAPKMYYGRTKEEAVRKLKNGQKLQSENRPIPREDVFLGKYLDEWLDSAKERGSKRYRTIEWYRGHVENHIKPDLGHIRLAQLKTDDVQTWLDQMAGGEAKSANGKPATPALCRALVRTLSSALGAAKKRGLVVYNASAAADLDIPSEGDAADKEIVPLSTAEATSFMRAIHDDDREALYLLSLALGVRQGEALGLCWSDVHLDAKDGKGQPAPWAYFWQELVWVKDGPTRGQGHYELQRLKTKKSRRQLSLPKFVADALTMHASRQDLQVKARERNKKRWANEWGLLFTTDTGAPLNGPTVTHQFQQKLEEAGLPKKRYYDLRHSAASFLAARGVPVFDIARLLGHSSTQLVNNTYGHWLEEGRQRVAQEMEAMFMPARHAAPSV